MGIHVMREVNKRVRNTNRRRIGNLRPFLGWVNNHVIIAAHSISGCVPLYVGE
jgi:hypothetical protein